MLLQVGCTEPYGPHGLRVLGYNLSKAGNGVDLTVAHGGWMSEAQSRYHRFAYFEVLSIPAAMIGAASQFAAERQVTRGRSARGAGIPVTAADDLTLDGLLSSDEEVAAAPLQHARALPDGYTRENVVRPSGRVEFIVHAQP